jgi:hypothetical protein
MIWMEFSRLLRGGYSYSFLGCMVRFGGWFQGWKMEEVVLENDEEGEGKGCQKPFFDTTRKMHITQFILFWSLISLVL